MPMPAPATPFRCRPLPPPSKGAELKRRWAMARADLAALLGRINGGEAAAA